MSPLPPSSQPSRRSPKPQSLELHLSLMEAWPDSWKGDQRDIGPGRALVSELTHFIRFLHDSGLSGSTIRTHLDNVWELGGEIIRDLQFYGDSDGKLKPLQEYVDEEGGPLLRHTRDSEDQRGFDATCRKLHRYLQTVETSMETSRSPTPNATRRTAGRRRSPKRR